MWIFYQFAISFVQLFLPLIALFSDKLKKFVIGRKTVWSTLSAQIKPNEEWVWFHAASLGEYEQAIPILERYKRDRSHQKILLTFFSPSGYELRKNNPYADCTVYLPMDTYANALRFIKIVRPKAVFFIKYELWPNYLRILFRNEVPVYLISAVFREEQVFFKFYGGFYKKLLMGFTKIFVQNQKSLTLAQKAGMKNVYLSGDTRFDRVSAILERDNQLPFMNTFCQGEKVVVLGSSWKEDERFWIPIINDENTKIKFVIAPHEIKAEKTGDLKHKIQKSCVLFSEREQKNLAEFQVMIVDAVGYLSKIYAYANIAHVGGGFGNAGLHNILEPATFGIPVFYGPNIQKFHEAIELAELGGGICFTNQEELNNAFFELMQNPELLSKKGTICSSYVSNKKGATTFIFQNLSFL
jgi:3-deoxy-D-manno-octulosonic-acid transferase